MDAEAAVGSRASDNVGIGETVAVGKTAVDIGVTVAVQATFVRVATVRPWALVPS